MQNPQCLLCLVLCLLSSSVVGEGRHLRGCQRRRLQRVRPALGCDHFEEPQSLNIRIFSSWVHEKPNLEIFPCQFSLFRNVLGTRNLGDILSEREAIASEMQEGLDEATDPWGVLVERVEVVHVDDVGLLDDDRLLDDTSKDTD